MPYCSGKKSLLLYATLSSSIHRMLRLLKPDQSKKLVPFKYRKSREIITG